MPQPYNLFTIYAREDARLLSELLSQLKPLEISGRIKVWSDREINPGVQWEKEIISHLDTADIILILVSPAYYNSEYIHRVEIKRAVERHNRDEAKVLPIIVRPCSFEDDPIVSSLQVLPTDGKAVTDDEHWRSQDKAWLDVVNGLKRTIALLSAAEAQKAQEAHEDEKRREQAVLAAEQITREQKKQTAERAENERLVQLRHEQEQAVRRAEQAAWQNAADTHDLPAYEAYLARYPQGEYAREARARIKELKKKKAAPLPLGRYAAIGGGALALLLAMWLVPRLFNSGDSDGVTQSHPVTDTSMQQQQPKDPDPSSEQTTEGVKTLSPSSLPENVTVGKPEKKEETAPPPVGGKKPTVGFNYPMVRVAGGTFTMGKPAGQSASIYDDVECQHTVTVGSFGIGKYEVTQAQWEAIMGDNPSTYPSCDGCPSKSSCDNCPIDNVRWSDIQEFIKKLNAATGKNYRLPKEAEWEFAAKGGNNASGTTKLYAGSDNLGSVAWYTANSGSKSHPVGGKSPNELGLYDMSGNVWEWCQDIYKPYPCDKTKNEDSSERVLRGGSKGDDYYDCRSAHRWGLNPYASFHDNGFRLAQD